MVEWAGWRMANGRTGLQSGVLFPFLQLPEKEGEQREQHSRGSSARPVSQQRQQKAQKISVT